MFYLTMHILFSYMALERVKDHSVSRRKHSAVTTWSTLSNYQQGIFNMQHPRDRTYHGLMSIYLSKNILAIVVNNYPLNVLFFQKESSNLKVKNQNVSTYNTLITDYYAAISINI